MQSAPETDFSHPRKKCDIVMKGGITSGIVYPSTICALAGTYRFMNIGGTSAGAIAAAAAAAAEYRRQSGSPEGFKLLAGLPDFLQSKARNSNHTNLYTLFQPDPGMRMLFETVVSFTKQGTGRYSALMIALLRGVPILWAGVVALGLLFAFLPAFTIFRHSVFGILSAMLWLAILLLAGVAAQYLRDLGQLPTRGFGLCSGMPTGPGIHQAITEWLHGFLSAVSGKAPHQPLTFGDLQEKSIQLRMISTCLTHGRPYGLPIDTSGFYFKEDEFRDYFPAEVVQWMKEHPGPEPEVRSENPVDTAGYCRLPRPVDMPVLVAARMSFSFPFLFRAVPLYTIDFTLRRLKEEDQPVPAEPGGAVNFAEARKPERCWFLDGGICSNFPVYMFDAPLPRWPTFGIDLQDIRKDRPDSKVWMPERNEEGLGEIWKRIADQPGLGALAKYIFGMIDAARNWTETRQMTVPGYRDRIVHIRLDDKNEGGLSLDMPTETVRAVSERGRTAGELLLTHFAAPGPGVTLTWDNHRWIRLRSFLGRLEGVMMQFRKGFLQPETEDRSYTELLNRRRPDPPDSYRLTEEQRASLEPWIDSLLKIGDQMTAAPANSRASRGEPKPVPVLHLLPRTVPGPDADIAETPLIEPQNEGERAVALDRGETEP
jgi:predicted acylesterase/phospholipase RssA